MEFGEGTANTRFKKIDPNDSRDRIKIRIGVFFDGTLNNFTNINQRLMASDEKMLTPEERNVADDLKRGKSQVQLAQAKKTYKKYGDPGEDNSYEGYYTNVYKLFNYTDVREDKTPNYKVAITVYIEGPGTKDNKGDKKAGFAFAMGPTGVPAKVKSGVDKVISAVREAVPDKSKIIELLTIDVYGFSRGAAGARKFIHDALFGRRFVFAGASEGDSDPDTTVRSQLTNMGYSIEAPGSKSGVQVCLAGLFDTVSTYGIGVVIDEDDNVDALSLNAVFHAEETIHLTAAEEHRYHFSLTDTQSAGSRGKQYYLPGVHSDIGGGYRDDAAENQPILGSVRFRDLFLLQSCVVNEKEANADKKNLVDSGWFAENEIDIENHDYSIETPGMMKSGVPPQLVHQCIEYAARLDIKNHYSTIPLQIMAKAAREKGVVLLSKIERNDYVPSELINVYGNIQSYISKQGNYTSKNSDWIDNREAWLKKIRHDYLHFSARMEPGHDPRIVDGKRVRKIYHG